MKILVINNTYRIFGGEDSNILDELELLKQNNDVYYLEFKNSEKFSIFDFLSYIFNSNFKSNSKLKKILNQFDPDLVYVHNTWFKAYVGIFKILKKNKSRVILKLHNFRYDCTKSYLLKNHLLGRDYCPKCGLKNSKFKFFNKYFPESILKSLFIIKYGRKYFKVISNSDIDLLVLTNFHKNYLIDLGISPKKISVLPNLIINYEKNNEYNKNSDFIVYAGRLEDSKGVREIIDAWIKSETFLKLKIIGDGQLFDQLYKTSHKNNVEILGFLEHKKTLELIQKSRGVITATKMFEGQPRILSEASLFGVPSIFPEFGGISEFFPKNYPLVFEQFNYSDLIEKVNMLQNTDFLQNLSEKIIKFTEDQFNESKYKLEFEKIFTKW